jgi:gliding motility-associated-like protein
MLRSSLHCLAASVASIAAFSASVFSQTITYQNPQEFFVCEDAPFEITVANTTGSTLQNVKVTVEFNTTSGSACGISYVAGTVSGAQEDNITNLQKPVFQIFNLASGAAATFSLKAQAPCSMVACIDDAEVFVNKITLSWNGGSTTVTTLPYVVETPLLVITAMNKTVMTGSQGDVLVRTITIRNTRPGALQNFTFTDAHQPGIVVSSLMGADVNSASDTFQIVLGGNHFSLIGDGDNLFELNETIIITEQILITDCGVDITSAVSNLFAGWGCNGQICQQAFVNAIVSIKPSTKQPALTWEPITNKAECFCGPSGYLQGMKITNTGNGAANTITLTVQHWSPDGGIDTLSVYADSAGGQKKYPVIFNGLYTPPNPCQPKSGIALAMIVTVPQLRPGASVTVYWRVNVCDPTCNQPHVQWRYRWSYYKPCPPNPFVFINDYIFVEKQGVPMTVQTSYSPSADPLQNDSSYTAFYKIKYDSLALIDDDLVIRFALPCGLIWDDDNDLLLNGKAPKDVTMQQGNNYLTITATYALPMTVDTAVMQFDFKFSCEELCLDNLVCRDSIITTCAAVDTCTISPPPFIFIPLITTIDKCGAFPLGCSMQLCTDWTMSYECSNDSVCIQTPPGYVTYKFKAERANLGLPDNNNDQLADPAGTLDPNLIRKDRAIAGDTIRVSLSGAVVVDVQGVNFPYCYVDVTFTASHLTPPNHQALVSQTGIVQAGITLRIFDKSAGVWHTCTNPTPVITQDGRLMYSYPVNAQTLAGCVPGSFVLENGDSLIFEGNYRIQYNIKRELDNDPLLGWLFVRPSMLVTNDLAVLKENLLDCGCTEQLFEVSGYEYAILPGIFAVPPCELSQFVGGSLLRLELEKGNFFPFEYRNLLTAVDWQVEIPASVSISQAKMTFLRYQGGANVLTNVNLTPVLTDGVYKFNLQQFQNPPLEEGFSMLFQYIFDAECDITGSLPMKATATLDFVSGLPEQQDPLLLTIQANALRALVPNLVLDAPLFDLVSFNNQLVFDFTLTNVSTVVASLNSGPAPNAWMYFTSLTGKVTDFNLLNPATGAPYPSINGVFQLGNLPVDSLELQLVATNNSCSKEFVQVHFGWNCDPYTSQIQTACNAQTVNVSILSPPGQIDMFVKSPILCSALCDTIPYHTIEIFNAQLGAVYELTLTGLLPPGLTVLPGTSEVEYPTGSGNFFSIGNPEVLNNDVVRWHISDSLAFLANGLPGVGFSPQNSLTLRFLAVTNCDFVTGAFSLFVAAAEQNCSIPSNTLTKPGDPICIDGIDDSYSANIGVQATPGFSCNDAVTFNLTLTASETITPGSCIIVTLPQGISYQAGSCSSVCQANFNCMPAVIGGSLVWQLPAGTPSNQLVCFEFTTTGWSQLGCKNGVVLFRSAAETLAQCIATGDTCSTKVSTGSFIFPYKPNRPEFDLSQFVVNATQVGTSDQLQFSIDVTNNGAPAPPPIPVEFYLDTDGNGTGDLLVHSANLTSTLGTGQTQKLIGSFAIQGGNLCKLVAYIDPAQLCACSGDSAYVAFPIVYQTETAEVVCSGEEITLGVLPMQGSTYQWTPANTCLSCQNCPSAEFNCLNQEADPVTYDFMLTESTSGGCIVENLLSVTVQPVPGILFAESPLCIGESANLVATDGVSYNWQGFGITNPSLQIQTVTPSMTSTYAVTVVDSENCSGSDTVAVEVFPLPMADAGPDVTFCAGEPAQLSATNLPGYSYLWSPGPPALNNPTIPNPVVLVNQNTTFSLTITDPNGCKASDAVTVSFGETPNLVAPPDLTICAGSTATLQVSGATNYAWSPAVVCQNPACSVVNVSPASNTTYTVTGTISGECPAMATVTVNVTTDTIVTNSTVSICEGETAVIHGEVKSDPGVYCLTVDLPGGCDSMSCVELMVFAKIDTVRFFETICRGASVVFEGQTYSPTQNETICVTYPTPSACDSTICLFVTVTDSPIDTMYRSETLCLGESVVFEGQTFTPVASDTICVTYPGFPSGCDSTICLIVTVLDTPQVNLVVSQDTFFIGDTIDLSISPSNFDSILWFANGTLLSECTNSPTCTALASESGEVKFSVVVVNENGCTTALSQTVVITILCEPEKVEIPNAFSPNGDTHNDTFGIVSRGDEEVISMEIWNRWGQKVYEGTAPWDGTFKGEPAPSEVYVYLIRIGCPAVVEAKERVLKGDVTLLR